MDRRHFLQGLGAAFVLFPLNPLFASSLSFDDFVKQQKDGFADYQAELDHNFKVYQQTINEEFKQFKGQVKKVWGDEKIGSSTVFVQYSENLKSRTIIDFKKGTMTVELIAAENTKGMGTRVRQLLVESAGISVKEAYDKDPLLQKIEKRLANQITAQAKASPGNEPVIADVLTGKTQPSKQQVLAAVAKAAKTGTASTRKTPQAGQKIFAFSIPLNQARISAKSEQYKPAVKKYAKQEKIDPALVLAIMHSESAFNPLAKSYIPAYGLMQIVPESAGKDASEKVYGQQRLLTPAYLYNSNNNIKMGCAYLNILYYRYLSEIANKESRIYCVIAAYNTGAGNVARAFGAGTKISRAAVTINRMSPQQVYARLISSLPYSETRNYIKKVLPRYRAYQAVV